MKGNDMYLVQMPIECDQPLLKHPRALADASLYSKQQSPNDGRGIICGAGWTAHPMPRRQTLKEFGVSIVEPPCAVTNLPLPPFPQTQTQT